MEKQNLEKLASAEYSKLLNAAARLEINFDMSDEGTYALIFGATVDGVPAPYSVQVHKELKLVTLAAVLPIVIPAERSAKCALAAAKINYNLPDGRFDYDAQSARVIFRLAQYYGCPTTDAVYERMFMLAARCVGTYGKLFLQLANGEYDPE